MGAILPALRMSEPAFQRSNARVELGFCASSSLQGARWLASHPSLGRHGKNISRRYRTLPDSDGRQAPPPPPKRPKEH